MRYTLLGRSGLRVSELCLGTMTFGEEWGWGSSMDECRRVYGVFRDRGGNFIYTANRYTNGTSEKIVGQLVAGHRASIVLATKYTLSMDPADPNACGNSRKNMMRSVEASLERLRTDYLDLLWVHAWDFLTPVEEVMRALDDLVRAGKVHYVGISDTPAWIVSKANTLAELRAWTPFSAIQIEYSLIQRTVERELVPMARALDLSILPWGILGGGLLSGKYVRGGPVEDSLRASVNGGRVNDRTLAIADTVRAIASDIGRSPSQVAIAWVRQRGSNVIPILGARKASQLEDNIGALDVVLSSEEMARLDGVSRVDLGFPLEFLSYPVIRESVFGNTYDKIDTRRRWRE
jgi:aryl-alcohol dehydrogenase-like predicted oxidoreductase